MSGLSGYCLFGRKANGVSFNGNHLQIRSLPVCGVEQSKPPRPASSRSSILYLDSRWGFHEMSLDVAGNGVQKIESFKLRCDQLRHRCS